MVYMQLGSTLLFLRFWLEYLILDPLKMGWWLLYLVAGKGLKKNKCPAVGKFPKVMFNLKVLTQNLRSMNKNYILQPLHPL